jgi:hypothetical protein
MRPAVNAAQPSRLIRIPKDSFKSRRMPRSKAKKIVRLAAAQDGSFWSDQLRVDGAEYV